MVTTLQFDGIQGEMPFFATLHQLPDTGVTGSDDPDWAAAIAASIPTATPTTGHSRPGRPDRLPPGPSQRSHALFIYQLAATVFFENFGHDKRSYDNLRA